MSVFRMKLWLFCLAAAMAARAAAAQEPASDPDDPEVVKLDRRSIRFLQTISEQSAVQLETAFAELFEGSRLKQQIEQPTGKLQELIEETAELHTKFGPLQGIEPIGAKRVGEDLVLLRYLYKCEDYPVIWYFTYYNDFGDRAGEGKRWIVIAIRFDTNLESLRF